MKIIKVKFVDTTEYMVNIFKNILSERYEVVISENPDYLFCSAYGHSYLDYDCIRIFFTSEQISPDFDLFDYAIGFDYLVFEDRYIRYPMYLFPYPKEELLKIATESKRTNTVLQKKFASFVVGNNNALTRRDDFFHLLSKYKKVDSGGIHLNNLGSNVKDKRLFLSQYKFNIAFENSSYNGYTTEKIIDAFVANTIPIYYGNPLIFREFNSESFINANEFDSFDELIEFIKIIDKDDRKFIDMLGVPKIIETNSVPSKKELKQFLFSVFDQEISKAKRRPHSQRSVKKEFSLRLLRRISTFYNRLPRFIQFILKPIRPKYK